MKIVVTGSLGNIGKPLTEELIQKGHSVIVISSKQDKQKDIEVIGAAAAIGSVEDVHFLTSAFTGADAVFVMIPPNFAASDPRKYYQNIGNAYATAIRQSGVKHIVHLSSWGADLDKGTGFIVGSHDVENILDALPNVAITHLRAGYFYYNLNNYIGMIKGQGIIGSNYGGEDKLVMAHPTDIAAAAAEEITIPTAGRKVRYVASDEHTPNEVAHILGAAIGKPDLQWITFNDTQVQEAMEKRGMPAHIAALSVELGASIHSGKLRQDYERYKPVLGKIKLEDFANEFALAYQKA